MSTFWVTVIAYLIGNAAGIVEMAILSGRLDERKGKRKAADAANINDRR